MAFSLSRNATLFVSYVSSGWDGEGTTLVNADTFEIPILDGFSFTQATGTQNVTLNESGTSPNRGQRTFNTSLEAAEWSFSTYVRPFTDAANSDEHLCTEMILWNALVSGTRSDNTDTNGGIVSNTTSLKVTTNDSESNQLLKLQGYIRFSDSSLTYKLVDMCVDSATIDFDIDGIAMINWTGYASSIDEVGATYPDSPTNGSSGEHVPANVDADFILNRLSTLTMASSVSGSPVTYTFPITGGSIAYSNNITYTIPEELGKVNSAVDHFTGTRAISGTLTAYLNSGAATDTEQLYEDMLDDINSANPEITNDFDISINIGGASAPNLVLNVVQAHIELPTIETADVMGLTITFTAMESTLGTADEFTATYKGATST